MLAFALGSQTATAVTGADGTATAEIVPTGLPGATPLAVAFAGEGAWSGSATSRLAVITLEDTILTLSGVSAVASGGAQPVSARLVDDDGQPLTGRIVNFRLGTATAEATTGVDGTATASLSVPVLAAGTARLETGFAGDAWYRSSSAATTVLVAQPTSFVIWGGNTTGLRLGDRVQFWGAQWSRQVRGGDYAAQADFKGWSTAPLPPRLCQPNAHTTGTPRLDASCWISKPGNSNPPAKLGSYVQVIVATSIAKNGSTIYGNIAATVVLQVDTSSAYGPDPGHPGYGTVIGVLEDGAGAFASSAASLISAQAATATRRISLYSPEMSLMAETELTTTARPAIPYEYIWFDGRPLAQVDGVGTVSWTFTDHLGTPLLQTSSLQGIVWRAEHEPYGSIYALRSYDRHQPLRFPGQEAEQLGTGANGVTERSYNVHRWYRAGWGRYTQADPLGLGGGINLLTYAHASPILHADRLGFFCTSDFVDHYFTGKGKPIDLATVQLLGVFRNSPSIKSATASFKQQVEAATRSSVKTACDGPCSAGWSANPAFGLNVQNRYPTDVTDVNCLFALGNGHLAGAAPCKIFSSCSFRIFCVSCNLSFKYRDTFKDPVDIFDWFKGEFEIPGAKTYPIIADWTERMTDCYSF
jgi:RHS repeat-associated protein